MEQGVEYACIPHHRRVLTGRFAMAFVGRLPGWLRVDQQMRRQSENGLSSFTPVSAKCLTFRVTKVRS
jgi:hypothetical protein